ncbi:MAG: rRNA pseudouridine synthase [Alphaproteobacteria bacterium]|nr:rRNA pseudouridine synthase [Alphaproteobacteria bacterium]
MRLNVFLQKSGIGSRREAERMIAAGRITINGNTAKVTDPVNDGDKVAIDGKALALDMRPVPRLFMLYKPLDVLVTTFDKEGRKTVYELPNLCQPKWGDKPRVMNVGRLDVNSEGLLMLSTDGQLAQAMMHPSTGLERTYRVRVHGRLTPEQLKRLGGGVTVDGVAYKGARVTEDREPTGKNTWYTVVLTEGKNREIRKLMEHFGCVVNRLIRTNYGPFKLGDLKPGDVREVPNHLVVKFLDDLQKRGVKL